MISKWILKSSQNPSNECRRPPKSDAKNKHNNWHKQNAQKSDLGTRMETNSFRKWTGTADLLVPCLALPSELPLGRPHTPKAMPKSRKKKFFTFSWTSAFVAAYVLFSKKHSESQCNYSLLDLYLLSLGRMRIVTQYAQIAWGIVWGCGDGPPQASSIN